MTTILVLAGCAFLLLVPLAVSAARRPALVTMAARHIGRRRGEAALVIGGALLGTAIITSSFVVGDVIEASFRDEARTRYGPIDLTVTSTGEAGLDQLTEAVVGAAVADVDGVLPVTVASATLESPTHGTAAPQVRLVEVDLGAAATFGGDTEITGVADIGPLRSGQVVINERTADRLGVATGDPLRLHAHGATVAVTVADVVPEIGLAGYGGAIVAPGTLSDLTGAATAAVPPRPQLLVSLVGGIFDTRDRSDAAVTDLRAAVADLPGVEVDAPKAAVLDDAEREGAAFTELFSIIGSFSVLAGILLLVNLFVMLAEERKTELGMLRALGFTRRRLTRTFAIEGAIYAVVAAVTGAVAGIGIGWVVAVLAGTALGTVDQTSGYPLVVDPVSVATGGSIGLIISLVTIRATSHRIARLNVIRAIRDLPEPPLQRPRGRTVVLAATGILVGTSLGTAGFLAEDAIALLLGVPVAVFSAAPLLRRVLPDRVARVAGAGIVLTWALLAAPLFPDIMTVDGNPALFVLQGVVLTAGAVSLAASLDRVWAALVDRFGGGGRGLAPRLGLAYPLARRLRTSLLLSMFSLVIFTVTILASVTATFERNTEGTVAEVAAGYHVVLDTDPANPADAVALTDHADVLAIAGLVRGVADFEAAHLDGARSWTVTGFDADLLARGTPLLAARDDAYVSDRATFEAVLSDPTLTIVPDGFLAGVGAIEVRVGDAVAVRDPVDGQPHELTVVGLGSMDWVGNGALVSRELTASLLGPDRAASRSYLALAESADAADVAAGLDAALLAHGAEAHTFTAVVAGAVGQQTGLLRMLQGFLGLGLLVGTAGLGVVMVRAVRERRQDIGVLRALGLRAGTVRAALLSEAGLIAGQGAVIGAVLGLLTTRNLLSEIGGDLTFTVPWGALLVIVGLPLVASLAATAWPASRAAALRPAVALRTAD
ncbi:FtsX-like permease family protein [Nitriliruptor alkaliphilus]|uniref:FtsX-like permease family protein n=1 Tax=Nitriliruptor alkaliphilus TaxID=427918 RepID=UPI0006975649|nr:FtsX-like permease family protein [Nitriliruptor alkaliphilus]